MVYRQVPRNTYPWPRFLLAVHVALSCLSALAGAATIPAMNRRSERHSEDCRNLPGDADWPTPREWQRLNKTVEGRLVATSPIANVCHDPTYSAIECDSMKQQWGLPSLHVPEPAEILAPYFQNQSCDPFTSQAEPCLLGNYVSYSIKVRKADDIVAGVKFAQRHNIRLVVKSTGHDFFGKSTGKGALALWTHEFNKIDVIRNYSRRHYQGPAMKVAAGVMGGDALLAAHQQGYRVVVGSCPTVGVAGGFTQGGGHSLLSGLYGLSADNVLEWEVITARGERVIASPTRNSDLFWALGGGGGGTFGVVVSMTVRLFDDGPVGRASLFFNAASTNGSDGFSQAVDVFQSHLQAIVDYHGTVVTYTLDKDTLYMFVATAPNRTAAELEDAFAPMLSALDGLGLSRELLGFSTAVADNYHDHYMATLGPVLGSASSAQITSGRFVSRDDMANNATAVGDAMRTATGSGPLNLLCTALSISRVSVAPVARSAVQPHWRNALVSCVASSPWDFSLPWQTMLQRQDDLTNIIDPALKAATPGSGAYLNEANFEEPDWQNEFYGSNYQRLKRIKRRYDPRGLFYGVTAVGSEAWVADRDGRLCRTWNDPR